LKEGTESVANADNSSGQVVGMMTAAGGMVKKYFSLILCGLCALTGCGGGGAAGSSNTPGSGSSGQNASFSLTGSMQARRSSHTATLLNNGKVLIAGGKDTTGTALAAAELFDPSTNAFISTGNMSIARWGHTATLLSDGRVLVVGGGSGIAELFDPNTGTFTLTGSITFEEIGITATLLKDGRVLVAGGGTATAELFDPSKGGFSPAGGMSTARTGAAASLLSDGRVLVAGGTDSNGSALGDLFDPASTTFSQNVNRWDTSPVADVDIACEWQRASGGWGSDYPPQRWIYPVLPIRSGFDSPRNFVQPEQHCLLGRK
jgi:WD40 repeat protein